MVECWATKGCTIPFPSLILRGSPPFFLCRDQTGIQEMEDSSIIFASRSSEDSLGRNSKGSDGNACTLPPGTYGSSGENDTSHELRDNGNQSSVLRCCTEDGDSCTGEDPQNERPSHQPCMVSRNSSCVGFRYAPAFSQESFKHLCRCKIWSWLLKFIPLWDCIGTGTKGKRGVGLCSLREKRASDLSIFQNKAQPWGFTQPG